MQKKWYCKLCWRHNPFSCATDITTVISELQVTSAKVFNWFGSNYMNSNLVQCDLLLSTKSPEVVSIDAIQITSNTAESLLGFTIDSGLKFENHLSAICKSVSRKINALGWIVNYISLEKRRIEMKTFIESQFNYCPWFGCSIHKPSIIKLTTYMKKP